MPVYRHDGVRHPVTGHHEFMSLRRISVVSETLPEGEVCSLFDSVAFTR